jgi:hypothetical protein
MASRRCPHVSSDLAMRTAALRASEPLLTCGGGVAAWSCASALIELDISARKQRSPSRVNSASCIACPAPRQKIALSQHQRRPNERLAELPTCITRCLHRAISRGRRSPSAPDLFRRGDSSIDCSRDVSKARRPRSCEQLRINEAHRRLVAQRGTTWTALQRRSVHESAVFGVPSDGFWGFLRSGF